MDILEKNIKDISNNYYKYFFNLQNVNGVGYGYKYINDKNTFEPCIHVFVEEKLDKKYLTQNNIVPKTYMGIKTDIIQAKKPVLINNKYIKSRPIKAGGSVGVWGTSHNGTICCIVKKKIEKKDTNKIEIKDKKNTKDKNKYEYYILSNNHVLADNGRVPKGSFITQPSVGSLITKTNNIVAMLDTFIQIEEKTPESDFNNTVDCAIAKLLDTSLISNEILGFTKIKGITQAYLNMPIKSSGATSGVRYGNVQSMHVTITSKWSNGSLAVLKEQIRLKLKSGKGDSGSPILTLDDKLIGIAAAALINQGLTVCSDINKVLELLQVEVYLG